MPWGAGGSACVLGRSTLARPLLPLAPGIGTHAWLSFFRTSFLSFGGLMGNRMGVGAIGAMAGCAFASGAHAICRVVEPAEDSGEEPVEFDPTTTALAVRVPDAIVDYDCSHAG